MVKLREKQFFTNPSITVQGQVGAQDTKQLGAREGAGGKDQGEREGLPLSGRDLFRHFPKLNVRSSKIS